MQTIMHPAFQEKLAVLAALRERTGLATDDFYTKVGRSSPRPRARFYATAKGNMWRVVDSHTGRTWAFRTTYEKAMAVLDGLEAGATSKRGLQ